jgi:hypothetical protein
MAYDLSPWGFEKVVVLLKKLEATKSLKHE